MTHWLEITITTSAAHANAIADYLHDNGASAVTFQDAGDDPILEPAPGHARLWQTTRLTGLFEQQHEITPLLAWLNQQQHAQRIDEIHINGLADQDWVRTCLQDVKPMRMGQRLWICPSWHTPPDPTAINVIIDPGLAFGTGTHATTALCLHWLDENIHGNERVIDYGCGSGILALAALKLGAQLALGIDTDPQALVTTAENVARNHLPAAKLLTALPDDMPMDFHADMIAANILAQPLLHLVTRFAKLLPPGGKIVLSGILVAQVDAIKKAYAPWFDLPTVTTQAEWACLAGQRRA